MSVSKSVMLFLAQTELPLLVCVGVWQLDRRLWIIAYDRNAFIDRLWFSVDAGAVCVFDCSNINNFRFLTFLGTMQFKNICLQITTVPGSNN